MSPDELNEKDELRAAFTRWLEVVIRNALRDFLRKTNRNKIQTVPIDSIDSLAFSVEPDILRSIDKGEDGFEFEEERLATAFRELPLMRRRILELLFVQELEPAEIAVKLHCSVQHVYNQRSLALKRLRELLMKGGGDGVE